MPKKKKKNGRAGYWEYHVAIVPLRVDFVPLGTGDSGSDIKVKWGRPVLIEDVRDEAGWKRFYEALLKPPRLAPKVRNAVMRELGRSPRNESAELTWGLTQLHRAMVNERKALMRKNGLRPRGGVHEAAIEEIASEQGLSVGALKWRLRNLKK
jgi:hypothetical protein